MRMLHRRAGGFAIVTEHHDVAKSAIFFQISRAFSKCPEEFLDLPFRHISQGGVVVRGFDHHLVSANPVHLVVHALALAVQIAFDAQRRKFVRHHTHAPTRFVTAAAVPISQDFRRRLMLMAVIEGADSWLAGRHRLTDKIAGTLRAIGGYDDPSPRDWVVS